MIFRTCLIVLLSFLWLTPTWASRFVVTDTHSYIVNSCGSDFEGIVYVRDIRTSLLTRIQVGKNPIGFYIYGRKGYVPNATSGTITVIDLNTHQVIKTITVLEANGHTIQDMIIEGSNAYIRFFNSRHLHIIDLETDTVSACVDLPQTTQSFTIYGDRLYAVHSFNKSISCLCLRSKLTNGVFHLNETPNNLIVMNRYWGYLLTYNNSIVILDLTNHRPYKTIQLSGIPQDMVLVGRQGYVTVHDKQKNLSSFALIDLDTDKVTKELKLDQKPGKIKTFINTAFVTADDNKHVWVIDLVHFQICWQYLNPENKDLCFNNTHLYKSSSIVHAEAVTSLDNFYVPVLFDTPYQGVTGDLWEDGETAYNSFINAMFTPGCPEARRHFDRALASGHPKVYAYAAYAILHECFGATWDLSYYRQFYEHCDKEYYQKLVKMFTEVLIQETL